MNQSEIASNTAKASRIIVALDFDNLDKANQLVAKLDPALCRLKVGKEMFTLFGPHWVKSLVKLGFDVFLDLKFHDIPNTVAKACVAAAKLGVWMINVHAIGGSKMMKAAIQAIEPFGKNRPLLTAVTVLTSMDLEEFENLGFSRSIDDQVLALATQAKLAGLDGVVCSPLEASSLSIQLGEDFLLVTPGIRPEGSDKGDQSRVMTPRKAIEAGSSYLVIGRPITQSPDPLGTLCEISESLAFS